MGWVFNLLHFDPSEPLKSGDNTPPHVIAAKGISKQPLGFVAPIVTEQQKRQKLYDTMTINSEIKVSSKLTIAGVPFIVNRRVESMILNKATYMEVAALFPNAMKWWLIALIHEMECSQNFAKYLGNGDSLNSRTTHVPKGRPIGGSAPFTFKAGAIDSLQLEHADNIKDWSIGNILYFLEGFNGYGYANFKHINSPYLWSGSNQYTSGKYVSDRVYDKSAVSQQIGTALLLKSLDTHGQL